MTRITSELQKSGLIITQLQDIALQETTLQVRSGVYTICLTKEDIQRLHAIAFPAKRDIVKSENAIANE